MALSRQKLTFERIRRFTLPEGKNQVFLWDTDVKAWHVEQLVEQKPLYSKACMREKPFA